MFLNGVSMNELSLNAEKTKYIFFQKQRDKENNSRCLPDLKFNDVCLKTVNKL